MSFQNVFNLTAATYDADRERLIPGYAELYGGLVALLPTAAEHVLDLGAGTGLLSAWVRERLPHVQLHLVDNADAMLEKARERFAGDSRVTFQAGNYTNSPLGGPYDAVVSALSIHHLTDDGKRDLFKRMRSALKSGGLFLNAEQVLAPDPDKEAEAKAEWMREVRSAGATEDQITASLLRQTEDRCSTVADQVSWLREAGFGKAWCAYQRGRFALLAASVDAGTDS